MSNETYVIVYSSLLIIRKKNNKIVFHMQNTLCRFLLFVSIKANHNYLKTTQYGQNEKKTWNKKIREKKFSIHLCLSVCVFVCVYVISIQLWIWWLMIDVIDLIGIITILFFLILKFFWYKRTHKIWSIWNI